MKREKNLTKTDVLKYRKTERQKDKKRDIFRKMLKIQKTRCRENYRETKGSQTERGNHRKTKKARKKKDRERRKPVRQKDK